MWHCDDNDDYHDCCQRKNKSLPHWDRWIRPPRLPPKKNGKWLSLAHHTAGALWQLRAGSVARQGVAVPSLFDVVAAAETIWRKER
mmetsp:Transcript_21048/g.58306  ORF Transcript_21048/g.58306 Transcript_21048/m.58306 type:complete len:86 (-) Transcript_21048:53-310(-)